MIYDSKNRTISTDRLSLRMFQKSDAETVSKLCNNFNVYKGTLNLPYPYPIECAVSWIENHFDNFNNDKSYEFCITDKNTGIIYGCIGLSNNQRFHNGEIGYWIGEEFWGKGYATEAAKAIVEFAFNEKQYHKVYARHFASNPASGRVMQKLGMITEGVLTDHIMKENKYENIIYYGIINY